MPSAESRGRIVALDANIMLAVGIRRLLCAMQELTGGAVWVTPRVWHEVWGRACGMRCGSVAPTPA